MHPPAMGSQLDHHGAVRYRGCLLLPGTNQSWLVRPERSPMKFLPFRTPSCSLTDLKALIDQRLAQQQITEINAA